MPIVAGVGSALPTKPAYNYFGSKAGFLPELVRKVSVAPGGGQLISPLDKGGNIALELYAFPQPEPSPFWKRALAAIGNGLGITEIHKLPPQQIRFSPRIGGDEFRAGFHTQLMGLIPFAVMETGTHYGFQVMAPKELVGQWETMSEPIPGTFPQQIRVGQKRHGLSAVFRVDDCEPLVRQIMFAQFFQELAGGFAIPAGKDFAMTGLTKRVTLEPGALDKPAGKPGETVKSRGTEADLIFEVPPEGVVKGDRADKQGQLEVVVFSVWNLEISEIITQPVALEFRSSDFGGGDCLKSMGGFGGGRTTYGRETKTKTQITTVEVIEPLAAFQLVMVGEKPEFKMQMEAVPDSPVQAAVPAKP